MADWLRGLSSDFAELVQAAVPQPPLRDLQFAEVGQQMHQDALSPSRGWHMLAFANMEGLVACYDMMETNAGPTFTWETALQMLGFSVIIGDLMQLLYNLRVFVCISQPMASKLFAYGPVKATMDCCSYFRVTVNLGTFGAESRCYARI
ncbi:unnamed protein product [Symbiodinium sp. CCMP2456]|nr:unnamed protein product [Symbiodinium sp. CCMP2456]